MDTTTAILLALLIFLVLAGAAYFFMRSQRTKQLRSRFGPEYARAVEETGDKARAEAKLHRLEKRVEKFPLRRLSTADRDRYIAAWHGVQAEFVDDPKAAILHADALLTEVMTARGYPMGEFEQRSADLSVDHAMAVQNYRAGHEIALQHRAGAADTEALRQAMIHYRALFDELVEETDGAHARAAE